MNSAVVTDKKTTTLIIDHGANGQPHNTALLIRARISLKSSA